MIRKILHSGKLVNLESLQPEDIVFDDIVFGLMQPRYNNQTPWPYSIAYHSVIVFDMCGNPKALLHDAAEAYIGDMHSELKHSEVGQLFSQLENAIETVIYARFGFYSGKSQDVNIADKRLLVTEMMQFWPSADWCSQGLRCTDGSVWAWPLLEGHPAEPYRNEKIIRLSYQEQEKLFRDRCREVGIR